MDSFRRLSQRKIGSNPRARHAPELSPATTIDEGNAASWGDPGGGASRVRYAWNTSSKAAGKGFCGARRWWTIKSLDLVD
jgi:hypothetical protein